jgi:uncharacterized protein DUF4019
MSTSSDSGRCAKRRAVGRTARTDLSAEGAWNEAGDFFKAAISQAQWAAAAKTARAPLGALNTRTLKSATARTTMPGAPDGEYVVFQYNTSFEQKSAALETVTTIRQKDGAWRVVGYFVR